MQQTKSLSNNTPTDLSPSFQDWLNSEKAAARSHRQGILKMTVFFVAIIAILLIKDQSSIIQELFSHAAVIAQP
jgi:hypothetical protein